MIATGLAQAAWQHAGALMELAPTPAPGGSGVNTDKVLGFFVKNIVPILLAALGAGAFFFFGEYLVNLIFG